MRPRLQRRLCELPCPIPTLIDGNMGRTEWIVGPQGLLKTDYEHHGMGKAVLPKQQRPLARWQFTDEYFSHSFWQSVQTIATALAKWPVCSELTAASVASALQAATSWKAVSAQPDMLLAKLPQFDEACIGVIVKIAFCERTQSHVPRLAQAAPP
jgi:hypothetical protein